ncbi:MAG: hypothetical protein F2780_03310 [Actinobacteria bacterium]|uniref:Unannotated protein n=1 Tax=freshwater metagenome TaxID=449393 RepID=A0A6J6QV44_9ZZZZ|nr:hypothetical protein [Actinomycetota bacterium]MUH55942.1 hypothetical protein [Actinomycetota bacterium]
MVTWTKTFGEPKIRNRFIPQELLVVRGARYHQEAIKELLNFPVPQSTYNPNPPSGSREPALWGDFKARLEPINHEKDPNAIQVMVDGKRVGFIGRDRNQILKPLLEGSSTELDCTIFWNGDPDADYQFYTVQLFS